jgi:hypothetical protein
MKEDTLYQLINGDWNIVSKIFEDLSNEYRRIGGHYENK